MGSVRIAHVEAAFARYASALHNVGATGVTADGSIDCVLWAGDRTNGLRWRVVTSEGAPLGFEGGHLASSKATKAEVVDRLAIAASVMENLDRRRANRRPLDDGAHRPEDCSPGEPCEGCVLALLHD